MLVHAQGQLFLGKYWYMYVLFFKNMLHVNIHAPCLGLTIDS